ncbi:CopD family protein [Halomonas sp. EGI 63088]|uniref:Protoporphyrinogen IX oxidase n=1 Tax=Halomonas flagellata TaxID=2920385 RepID=A0ABS9RVD0_9GAMM|nr:CopD family protein [Halomonas flagellata]MCH4563801.1 CopD family protein [Halomonas flagellata]
MPWIKFLHIVALVSWCGALLYLPALLMVSARSASGPPPFASSSPPMPRFVYNGLATPAALLAIVSGTLLFLVHGLAGSWLVLKLLAVTGMVMAHGACGWLVLRLEQGQPRGVAGGAVAAGVLAATAMLAVVTLVLAKPAW